MHMDAEDHKSRGVTARKPHKNRTSSRGRGEHDIAIASMQISK